MQTNCKVCYGLLDTVFQLNALTCTFGFVIKAYGAATADTDNEYIPAAVAEVFVVIASAARVYWMMPIGSASIEADGLNARLGRQH